MITSSPQRIKEYTDRNWWGNRTLHDLLQEQVEANPELLAVADQPNRDELTGDAACRLTFRELDNASTALACQLMDAGISADDTVIVQLPNIAELVVCYMACSKIGAIISPIPVQYGRHELSHISSVISPQAIITIGYFRDLLLAKNAQLCLDNHVKVLTFGGKLTINSASNEACQSQLRRYQQTHPADANHIITICWTSGTTGTPKGVPRSHNMWIATAKCCAEAGNYRNGDRFLNVFPLVNMASIGGFLFPAFMTGCSIILHHPMDPGLYLTQLQNEKITFTLAPPLLLNQLAKSPEMWGQFDFSHLRSIGSGSAPLAPWMIDTFSQNYGLDVINFYGSNEGISLFCTPMHTPDSEVRATMFPRLGCGIDHFDSYANKALISKVIDTGTGEVITRSGQIGELLFAGATVFDGYLCTDNTALFRDDGYFHTGDLVEICGEPPWFYRVAGRCKDIINRAGMKISPAEIDILLEGLPGSAEAAVCKYQDDELGEKICACIVMEPDIEIMSLTGLTDYLSALGVAKFKLPERIEFFDSLPRNPLAKVQRFALEDSVSQRQQENLS